MYNFFPVGVYQLVRKLEPAGLLVAIKRKTFSLLADTEVVCAEA